VSVASVADDVADGIAAAVEALAIPDAVVRRRKVPTHAEGEGAVVVSVAVLAEAIEDAAFEPEAGLYVTYPVLVTMTVKGEKTIGDAGTVRGWRQAIRRVVYRAVYRGGVGFAVEYDPRPAYDGGALRDGYELSSQLFRVTVFEDRGDGE
jgi:hypothetical protein